VRILLCDDHALFREGLEMVIRQLDAGTELVGVDDAEAALAHLARDEDLDLVLLDIALPGMNGWAALSLMRARHPSVPVIVLSASERPEDAHTALERGAAGFIPKSSRASVLLGALRLVLAGGVYVPPLVLDAPSSGPTRAAVELSPRQVEVLRLLARGLTNKEISAALGIAVGTVKSHVMRLYEVLSVANRTEAAMRMRELGIDPE